MSFSFKTSVLHQTLSLYLNPNAYDIECMARWVRGTKPAAGMEEAQAFKEELREALDHPGVVTPQLYESWTGEDMDDQDAVQNRLKEVWDWCFE